MELGEEGMTFSPSLEMGAEHGFLSLIEGLVNDIYNAAKLIPRLAKGRLSYKVSPSSLRPRPPRLPALWTLVGRTPAARAAGAAGVPGEDGGKQAVVLVITPYVPQGAGAPPPLCRRVTRFVEVTAWRGEVTAAGRNVCRHSQLPRGAEAQPTPGRGGAAGLVGARPGPGTGGPGQALPGVCGKGRWGGGPLRLGGLRLPGPGGLRV